MILPTDSFTRLRQKLIAELAGRLRLPSISAANDFPKDGGLMSYGANFGCPTNTDRRQATSIAFSRAQGRAICPCSRPTSSTLVINLKTAKALGLTVPILLLGLADEVIE